MGLVKNNLLTKGFSGKIGEEIVFRQVRNRTRYSKAPRLRESPPSQREREHRDRFQKAVYYAKSVLLDEVARAEYELMAKRADLPSAHTAAVTDFLTVPEIASVYIDNYEGRPGDVIFVAAVNSFKIQELFVTIVRADNTQVESGPATRELDNWKYITTQPNTQVAGCIFVITAKDRPGKDVRFEQAI